jgi:hypothetical protein
MRDSVFLWRFIAIFLLLKNPDYQYKTKGGFHVKSQKTDSNFFGVGAGG